jgi:hypothetical protein
MMDVRQRQAYEIHLAEAERAKAEVYNLGWGVNSEGAWISIASKTSEGILTTDVDFSGANPKITHEWSTR